MRIHQRYPHLVAAVKQTHMENGNDFHAHDFLHAMRVGWMAERIAEDPEVGRLAAVAGLCHNADRILQKMNGFGPSEKIGHPAIIEMCRDWLNTESGAFSEVEIAIILNAVLNHGDINRNEDSPVMVTLKDSDRLVNMSGDWILRATQYATAAKPGLPVVDPFYLLDTPGQTLRNPGSILSSLPLTVEDWVAESGRVCIRLPKARVIAMKRVAFVRTFVATALEHLADEEIDQSVFA